MWKKLKRVKHYHYIWQIIVLLTKEHPMFLVQYTRGWTQKKIARKPTVRWNFAGDFELYGRSLVKLSNFRWLHSYQINLRTNDVSLHIQWWMVANLCHGDVIHTSGVLGLPSRLSPFSLFPIENTYTQIWFYWDAFYQKTGKKSYLCYFFNLVLVCEDIPHT